MCNIPRVCHGAPDFSDGKGQLSVQSATLLSIGSLRELPNCSMSDLVNYGLKHSPAPNPYGRVRTTLPQAAMAVSAGPADADYLKPHFPKVKGTGSPAPPAGQNGTALSPPQLLIGYHTAVRSPAIDTMWPACFEKLRSQWNRGGTRPDTSRRCCPRRSSAEVTTELTVRGEQ